MLKRPPQKVGRRKANTPRQFRYVPRRGKGPPVTPPIKPPAGSIGYGYAEDDRHRATLEQLTSRITNAIRKFWPGGVVPLCPECGSKLVLQDPFEGSFYTAVDQWRCQEDDFRWIRPDFEYVQIRD